jgi:hypothetical protein
MPYVFSGKLEVSKGQNPNFNFDLGEYKEIDRNIRDEVAEYAADVLVGMERRCHPITEAILRYDDRKVKIYPRMEKESEVLVF